MVDHVAHRLLRGGEEVGPVRGCRVVRSVIGRVRRRRRRDELWLGEPPAGTQPEAERDAPHHLDGGHADLAVALGGVGVADAEQRTVDQHGQEERRAGDELLDVHVAARAPRRHRAVTARLVERHAHDAGERRQRHRHAVVHACVPSIGDVPDL